MATDAILVESRISHVMLVTLRNPPVNALTTAMYRELAEVFRAAGSGDERCVVLYAEGQRAFCAGGDKNEVVDLSPTTALARARMVRECFAAVRDCDLPVLAAVGGPALGAGATLAASADIVVASDNAVFGLPEIDVGVMGGSKHMSRLVPATVLRWMALSRERIPAAEVARYGGVVRVTSRESLLDESIAMASQIARKGPQAVRLMKEVLNLTEDRDLASGLHVEQLGTAIMSALPESKEAAAATRQHRRPDFS
ncbi:enoyl-CoA hydratase-related protein [Pseudofrankia sp. BMG5.37]|uniref:enoyl-CoA hydratase-related protein n=1 Tax=Pseudofrankia sp. BMG5.37 TaxID=3050035 RepID=UPI002895F41D|nr:enoyl-CoA hydratase-related protein [Pseudofrankia sp. BMG5.37]MDT3444700.1 enoyl-CoA hydratase-related protein [Pseudofrankia sp. BMG5.37]